MTNSADVVVSKLISRYHSKDGMIYNFHYDMNLYHVDHSMILPAKDVLQDFRFFFPEDFKAVADNLYKRYTDKFGDRLSIAYADQYKSEKSKDNVVEVNVGFRLPRSNEKSFRIPKIVFDEAFKYSAINGVYFSFDDLEYYNDDIGQLLFVLLNDSHVDRKDYNDFFSCLSDHLNDISFRGLRSKMKNQMTITEFDEPTDEFLDTLTVISDFNELQQDGKEKEDMVSERLSMQRSTYDFMFPLDNELSDDDYHSEEDEYYDYDKEFDKNF